MNPVIIKELIESGLPDADILVEGDDGTHFQARIKLQTLLLVSQAENFPALMVN